MNRIKKPMLLVGISFVTVTLARRTQFHHARLAEHITPYISLHGETLSQIGGAAQQQAQFISCLDVFHILGLVALCVWPVTLLLRAAPGERLAGRGKGVVYEH